MSNPEPSVPTQEQVPFTSSSSAHASTIDPTPAKKATSKKRKMAIKADPVKLVDASATRRSQCRYEPYRKTVPTPEPEENCPADLKDLQTLDATAKKLYKSDLEMLEYIETLKGRTAAILKQVNLNDTQLRSGQSAMARIEQYVRTWQRMKDRWTDQQLFGDDNFRAKWKDGKRIILGPDESADEEEGSRCAKNFSFWICLALRFTGTPVYSPQWSAARTEPTLRSKSTFSSMLDFGR